MFEVGLMQLLKNNSDITALVSGRIFAGRIPKNATDSTYPCVVWTIVSTTDDPIIQGSSGFRFKRVQIDTYGHTSKGGYMATTRVSDVIRRALTGFHGSFPDGTFVDSSVVITDQDFLAEPGVSGELFRRMLEFQIAYRES